MEVNDLSRAVAKDAEGLSATEVDDATKPVLLVRDMEFLSTLDLEGAALQVRFLQPGRDAQVAILRKVADVADPNAPPAGDLVEVEVLMRRSTWRFACLSVDGLKS